MSNVWNRFQEKTTNKKTLTKKAQIFFWFPVKDIKISDIFYKIQKFLRISWTPIITTNGINFLMSACVPVFAIAYIPRKLNLFLLLLVYSDYTPQLSAEACTNNWLSKTLKSVQLHPNIIALCPAMVDCCYSNLGPQYKITRFFSSKNWTPFELGTTKFPFFPFLKPTRNYTISWKLINLYLNKLYACLFSADSATSNSATLDYKKRKQLWFLEEVS